MTEKSEALWARAHSMADTTGKPHAILMPDDDHLLGPGFLVEPDSGAAVGSRCAGYTVIGIVAPTRQVEEDAMPDMMRDFGEDMLRLLAWPTFLADSRIPATVRDRIEDIAKLRGICLACHGSGDETAECQECAKGGADVAF